MKIEINGIQEEVPAPLSMEDLLKARQAPAYAAVALNGEFVPRSRYRETILKDGDSVEILAPMQGG